MNTDPVVPGAKLARRLRIAGLLVIGGLLVQLLTLLVNRPPAFIAFVVFGAPLAVAGVLLYLYSILHHGSSGPAGPATQPSKSTAEEGQIHN